MSAEYFFFFILAFSLVVSSLLVISLRNPVHCAISLVVTMLLMAGTYALLNAPFLAIIQVMVYAGAIMVLFLFVIMLLNLTDEELGERKFTLSKFLTSAGAVFLFGALFIGIVTLHIGEKDEHRTPFPGLHRLVDVPDIEEADCSRAIAGVDEDYCSEVTFGRKDDKPAGTFDEASQSWIPSPELQRQVAMWERYGSVESVGASLFGKWVFLFELTGILLLAAVVGAVIIAKRRL